MAKRITLRRGNALDRQGLRPQVCAVWPRPGIVYGHGREPQSLSVVARDLDKLLSSIAVSSTVVELGLGGATTKTLIREIQRHPFKKMIAHIDFQELVAGEKVTVDLPLVFVGVPGRRRLSGGALLGADPAQDRGAQSIRRTS
jgi:ribosomal protein L25 (general stress protein Ctc)